MKQNLEIEFSLTKRTADYIFQLANMTIQECKKRGERVPKKFPLAQLAVACRFYKENRKRGYTYKANPEQLAGLLETIGGWYCAVNELDRKYGEATPAMMKDAEKMLKEAIRIENYLKKKGVELPSLKTKLQLIPGGKTR